MKQEFNEKKNEPSSEAVEMGKELVEAIAKMALYDENIKNKNNVFLFLECRSKAINLINNGADLNQGGKGQLYPLSPIMYACFIEDILVMNLLIEKGADVNFKDANGRTPILLTAKFGKKESFDILLFNGANVLTKSNEGETVLTLSQDKDSNFQKYITTKVSEAMEARVLNNRTAIPVKRFGGFKDQKRAP